MTGDRERWDEISGRYVDEVEAALAGVDHPRKGEVIANLREHLAEKYVALPDGDRSTERFACLLEEMGPPEEYAELLSGEAALRRSGRILRVLVVLLILAVALGFYGFFWRTEQGRSARRQLFGVDFSATPFFSKDAFSRVERGMTRQEVRDLIGYPVERYSMVGAEDELFWRYSTAASVHARTYSSYDVIFFKGKVFRTAVGGKRSWLSYLGHGPGTVSFASGGGHWPKWIEAREGEIVLTRADGTKKVLDGNDDITYLIVRDHDGYREIARAVEVTNERVGRLTANVPPGSIKVLRVYNGQRHAEYGALVDDYFVSASPLATDPEAYYGVVYSHGKAYCLPPVWNGEYEEQWREDQRWLVERLAGKSH